MPPSFAADYDGMRTGTHYRFNVRAVLVTHVGDPELPYHDEPSVEFIRWDGNSMVFLSSDWTRYVVNAEELTLSVHDRRRSQGVTYELVPYIKHDRHEPLVRVADEREVVV